MTPRIQKAIDIFLDAINKGTLAKSDCTKCAVGNLVRVGMGYSEEEYRPEKLKHDSSCGGFINWSAIFSTDDAHQSVRDEKKIYKKYPFVKQQIESTDFTLDELKQIEFTFETNTEILYIEYDFISEEYIRNDQIKGLEAVIKLMMTFDDVQDSVKEVFTNRAELIEV